MKNNKIISRRRFGLFVSILLIIISLIIVTIIVVKRSIDKQQLNAYNKNLTSQTPASKSNTPGAVSSTQTPALSPSQTKTNEPTPKVDPTANTGLENGSNGWYYMPVPDNLLFTDTKATTNAGMLKLIEKYRGIWQQNTNEKVVYITMDTGEDCLSNLNKILSVAKEKNVTITFFLTGSFIKQFPDMVRKMANEGHIVANHTYTHPNLPEYLGSKGEAAFKKQITDVEDEYKKVTGKDMVKILRPPQGAYSERVFDITSKMGYRLGFWSFAYKDWVSEEQPSYDYALNKVLGQAHPGSVMLLHPKSATNTAIFAELIDKLKDRGYSFKGLDVFP